MSERLYTVGEIADLIGAPAETLKYFVQKKPAYWTPIPPAYYTLVKQGTVDVYLYAFEQIGDWAKAWESELDRQIEKTQKSVERAREQRRLAQSRYYEKNKEKLKEQNKIHKENYEKRQKQKKEDQIQADLRALEEKVGKGKRRKRVKLAPVPKAPTEKLEYRPLSPEAQAEVDNYNEEFDKENQEKAFAWLLAKENQKILDREENKRKNQFSK